MSNIFKNNAYYVLGLDTTASQKDILKRSKEIIKRLKIDDVPEFDTDLDIFENFRTEESVNESVQKLQNPRKKITEYFFWFQIVDNIDEQAFDLLKLKDYDNAILVWKTASLRHHTKLTFQNIMDKYNNSIPHEIPLVSILQPSVLRLIF